MAQHGVAHVAAGHVVDHREMVQVQEQQHAAAIVGLLLRPALRALGQQHLQAPLELGAVE